MANIAILNYCNLKCEYCFADDMIQEESTSIIIEDYQRILEFLSRGPQNYVGIIGGEPTLHPEFIEIASHIYVFVSVGMTFTREPVFPPVHE
mgnify:CR=1 FL=1